MNTDKKRGKRRKLPQKSKAGSIHRPGPFLVSPSVFICVHLWLISLDYP
jgi:hypothetical protein